MRKFFTITFIALIILFAYGMFTKGKQNLYFYLASPKLEFAESQGNHQFQACQPKVAVLRSTLSYNSDLQSALNWMLSFKTPKVAGLQNPFYASSLTASVTELNGVTFIDIQGDPLLDSECFESDFKVLIQKTIEYYMQGSSFIIQLNGSESDFQNFGRLK